MMDFNYNFEEKVYTFWKYSILIFLTSSKKLPK